MTEDFKDIQEKPTLTLDPFQETAVPKAEFPAMQEEPEMDETVLSEEERQMAEQFAQQIDLTDSSMILQYGIGTQKKMADSPSRRWKTCVQRIWARLETCSAEWFPNSRTLTRKKKRDSWAFQKTEQ